MAPERQLDLEALLVRETIRRSAINRDDVVQACVSFADKLPKLDRNAHGFE